MRVEINFSGDSSEAVISSEEVTKAVRKLFVQAEETAHAVQEIRISAAQAAESSREARRMAQSIEQIGQEARKSRREVEQLRLAAAGSGGGFGGLLPGGARPRTAAFGLLGLLGAAGSGPAAGGAAALGVGALGLTGGALGAVGVLVGAFHGLGKAIDGDRQAFEKLSPATQTFVQDVRSLIPWLHSLQETARAGLLPGIDKAMHELLNPQTASGIQNATKGISSALGDVAVQLGKTLGGPGGQRFLNDGATHGVTQIRNLGDATNQWAQSLQTLIHAGQPVTDWLTKVIDDGSRYVNEFLKAQEATGGLTSFMQGAKTELQIVGKFLGALVDAAGQLSFALLPLGNQILKDLTGALQSLADWLQQNHDKVVEITTGALTGLEQIVRILSPLVATLAGDLSKVADAVGGWDQAFQIILGGVLLKALLGIGTAAGEKGAAGKVGLLGTRLAGLNAITIAPIVIPLALAMGQKEKDWLQKHGGKWGAALFDAIGTVAGGGIIGGPGAVINDLTGGGGKGGGKFDYPLATTGKIIGAPYQGTHGKAFNQAGGSDNWESENAVDIAVKEGTPVVAVEDGVIGQQIGSFGGTGRFAGLRLHLLGDSGNEYYYAHLSTILVNAGDRVKKGQALGMSGSANGVAHLHFAQKNGNPQGTISGAALAAGLTAPTMTASGGGSGSGASAGAGGGSPFGKPPAFNEKGANILPAALRLAMAKAQTTPGTGDDKATIQAAVTWLKANVGGFTGEDQINAYLELASLLGQLKTLAPKVAKKAPASKASLISARGQALALDHLLMGDPATTRLDGSQTGASYADATLHLDALRRTLGPKIRAVEEEIAKGMQGGISAKALAVLRANLARWKSTIVDGVRDVQTALAEQKTNFQQAWQKIADATIASLEEQRANYKSPARLLLDTLTATHDTQALNDALDQANADLATALKGHQADAQSQLDQIRQYVGTSFLVNALDAAQSAILGGQTQQISGQAILDKLHGILAGGNVVDPEEVKRAQKAVEEAKYQIQIAGLQRTASAEESAYNASIDAQESAIRQMAANWETYFAMLHGNIAAVPGWWVATLNAMGLTDAATAVAGDPNVGGGPGLALQNIHQQALSGAITTAQMQYLTMGRKLDIPGFAGGGDFITTGPTPIMVGEGGLPERVRVTPASGGGHGDKIEVHNHFPPELSFLEDKITTIVRRGDNVEYINRAVGVSANVRSRSGRI